ncbi:MAG: DUF1848 domain-containing protein [Spirochaetia bacterium]|nr:DUF1848 domain-containing protein [Spirochaetia bacterium]MCF7940647.1 DUF1848 domain-containing protein [Spirochaetia bacterium]
MILSISRRTDIPACYSPWLSNRFKEGVVYVRNPYDRHLVSSVDLHRSVDGIVFWSKDPRPMFEYLPQFDLIPFYVQFTLNGYGRELEPHVPDPVQLLETFRVLSDRIGPHRVIWRYDPVIITDEYTCAYHKQTFDTLAAALQGYTETCVISFLDIGRKNRQQMQAAGVQEITTDRVLELASFMADSGASHGMTIQSCAEPYDLSSVGISHGACIDTRLLERIGGYRLDIGKDPHQRKLCGCATSIDIGSYDTCTHLCTYCYANSGSDVVFTNHARHHVSSPLLIGELGPKDRVVPRKCSSSRILQGDLGL